MQHQFSQLCCALGLCASLIACTAESVQPQAAAQALHKQTAQPSAAALREVLSRAGATVTVIKRPDGLTQIDTLHGFHSASVAHRGPDGRVEQTCIHTAEELDHMMAQDNGAEP